MPPLQPSSRLPLSQQPFTEHCAAIFETDLSLGDTERVNGSGVIASRCLVLYDSHNGPGTSRSFSANSIDTHRTYST